MGDRLCVPSVTRHMCRPQRNMHVTQCCVCVCVRTVTVFFENAPPGVWSSSGLICLFKTTEQQKSTDISY